jgi:hypothetical protein
LRNQNYFLYSRIDHLFHFRKNFFHRERFLFSSDLRDDAERATIVASFGDFEIFEFILDIGIHSGSLAEFKVSEGFAVVSLHDVF